MPWEQSRRIGGSSGNVAEGWEEHRDSKWELRMLANRGPQLEHSRELAKAFLNIEVLEKSKLRSIVWQLAQV
jgi:hypothetical protein